MNSLASTSFALFFFLASGAAIAEDGESTIFQMPSEGASQAFVEQLPETAVVPVPGTVVPSPKPPKAAKPRSPSPKRAVAYHSIFPNVGTGVNARADAGQPSVHLPTVGDGVTQSL